jgi:VanZ family protein
VKTTIKRKHKRKNKRLLIILVLLLILWIALIFSFSLHAGQSSHMESGSVKSIISAFLKKAGIHVNHSLYQIYAPFVEDKTNISSEEFVRKTAHFIEYFALGVICYICAYFFRKRAKWWPAPLLCALPVALIDEMFIQRYIVSGRRSAFTDVLLDCTGFYCAVLLIVLTTCISAVISWAVRRRKGK